MTGETKRFFHGTTTTLASSGGSITSGAAPVLAGTASLDLGAYTAPADYPNVRFVLAATMASGSGIEGKVVELIARDLDVDGTGDTEAPTATFRFRTVGMFLLKGVATLQYMVCDVYDAPRKADFYLFQGSTITLNAGWTLKATPFTFGPV